MTSPSENQVPLEILLPVHNEVQSIEGVITEIFSAVPTEFARLLVCEDGSRDGTPALLAELQSRHIFTLHHSEERKGYSRAVKEGLLRTNADYVLCLDSDGQCDPREMTNFWRHRNPDGIVIGFRSPRRDPLFRRLGSRLFFLLFCLLFTRRIQDPSCPMVLIPKRILDELVGQMGLSNEAFWWEFSARCHRAGFPICQIPIQHRARSAGKTNIYALSKLPGILLRNVRILISLRFARTTG